MMGDRVGKKVLRLTLEFLNLGVLGTRFILRFHGSMGQYIPLALLSTGVNKEHFPIGK